MVEVTHNVEDVIYGGISSFYFVGDIFRSFLCILGKYFLAYKTAKDDQRLNKARKAKMIYDEPKQDI